MYMCVFLLRIIAYKASSLIHQFCLKLKVARFINVCSQSTKAYVLIFTWNEVKSSQTCEIVPDPNLLIVIISFRCISR